MKISKIIIKGFRQFENFQLDLTNPETGEPLDKVCFIGPNGTGKSTLLRVVLWLLNQVSCELKPIGGPGRLTDYGTTLQPLNIDAPESDKQFIAVKVTDQVQSFFVCYTYVSIPQGASNPARAILQPRHYRAAIESDENWKKFLATPEIEFDGDNILALQNEGMNQAGIGTS